MDEAMRKMRETLAHRFGAALPEIAAADGPSACPETWQKLAAAAPRGTSWSAGRPGADRDPVRAGAVVPDQERPAAARHRHRRGRGHPHPHRRAARDRAAGAGVDPGRARASRVLRQQPPAAAAARVARQAVRQRSPRRVLQCSRRCRHRAVGLRHRGRGGGARLRPHQRHPQPRRRRCRRCSACRITSFRSPGSASAGRRARHHVSLRLPLSATVHRDRFSEAGIEETVDAYDRRRPAVAPIRTQRSPDVFGTADFYGWSEDKVRQYATPRARRLGRVRAQEGLPSGIARQAHTPDQSGIAPTAHLPSRAPSCSPRR